MPKSARRKLPAALQEQVRRRANNLCEYCHTDERWQYVRFTIDHIIPLAEGGDDEPGNLSLACFHCNRCKSDKRTVVDRRTGQNVPLLIRASTNGQIISFGQPTASTSFLKQQSAGLRSNY